MENQYLLERTADEILARAPKSSEYPFQTRDQLRRVQAHEVCVSDVEIADQLLAPEQRIDRLKIRERAAGAVV